MKVLIIGAGFIAKSIIQELHAKGYEVATYSRSPRNFRDCQEFLGDIFDFEDVIKALSWSPQVVIHTAWITTPGLYKSDTSNFDYARFTKRLATHLLNSDVEHLIVLGTCAEYGLQNKPIIAGKTPLNPRILYAEQKVWAFNEVSKILGDSSIHFNWARIFYPYGPGQDKKRLIPQLFHALSTGADIQLADTTSVHDWTTSRDVASAISWLIEHRLPAEIDIGTSFGYTNVQLLLKLADKLEIPYKLSDTNSKSFGLGEFFVVSEESPILKSGWTPRDTIITGLEWALSL